MNKPEYEIPREISLKIEDKRRIFPRVSDAELDKLRITDVALFSTTPPDQSAFVCQILKLYYGKSTWKMTITDANGCIGGNTYCLIKMFKNVNFVEISNLHMEIFKHNLSIISPLNKNISFYTDNYLNMISKLKQDVIFLDPPWGGPDYYRKSNLELYYTDSKGQQISVSELIENELNKLTRTIILKVPLE